MAGSWSSAPRSPAARTQGQTEDEALTNIREAIVLCLEAREEAGLPATIGIREVEVPLMA